MAKITAVLEELARRAAVGDVKAAEGIRAYHGSPHDFDRFSTESIGTGEGAQAYGHGLYFAESEDVAKAYRHDLTGPIVQRAQNALNKAGNDVDLAIENARNEIDRLKSLDLTEETGASKRDSLVATQEESLSELTNLKNTGEMSKGRLYEVSIDANPDEFLDWDKPLSQQSEKVREAVEQSRAAKLLSQQDADAREAFGADYTDNWRDTATGQSLYGDMMRSADPDLQRRIDVLEAKIARDPTLEQVYRKRIIKLQGEQSPQTSMTGQQVVNDLFNDQQSATESLQDLGVKGIRYNDGFSRGNWQLSSPDTTVSGKWMVKDQDKPLSKGQFFDSEAEARNALKKSQSVTSNFVIFDDRLISISKKYGISIPLATAVLAGSMTPEEAQAGPLSAGTNVLTELAKRANAGDTVARQVIDVEAARLTSQGFPEDTAMRIATGELPMDAASRNARAVEQGYDPFETWYHGTADDIAAFDPAKSQSRDFGHAGKGTYVASHPGIARAYANTAAGSADANIMPLRTSANNPLRISLEQKQLLGQAGPSATAKLQQQAISEGFDSVEVIMPNGEILEKVIFDPANIRSTNAAFDPANKGKSALLGGLGGAAVVGGSMTPEEAQAGPLKSGIDVVTELAKRAAAGDTVAAEGIRAYHGSPYSFDEFSTSQIGTGEGAQAYGRGLYFAESEDVARQYKNNLSRLRKEATIGGEPIDDPVLRAAIEITSFDDGTVDIGEAIKFAEDNARVSSGKSSLAWQAAADKMRGVNPNEVRVNNPGRMYEVNIDATPDDFLDYDLPLSQQSDKVRSSVSGMLKSKGFDDSQIQAIIDRDIDGQELNAMLGSFDESKGVKHMTGQGIKGIRYKDGFSRGADGGSSNYVVFDDKLIDITKKYGVGPVAAAAILAGTMTPEEAQAGLGGMGVQMPQQRPEPTGADLMQQANDDFLNSIFNQPGSLLYGADQTNSFLNPDTYNLTYDDIADTSRGAFNAFGGFVGDMEQMLIGGIMQGIGKATTWEDALKMIGGGLGQEIVNAPEGRFGRFEEGIKNYDPAFITSKEVGEQIPEVVPRLGPKNEGRTKAFEMFGGFFSPI